MLISITGTPGTGKTTVAKIIAKRIGARLVTTGYLVKKYKIKAGTDKKRRTKIIDTRKLSAAVKKEGAEGIVIFEGHLSHFAPADVKFILRTSPFELAARLKKKKWGERKISENVEAEALGIISDESDGIEVDTTGKNPEQVALGIIKILNRYSSKEKYARKIDWTEEHKKYLAK